MTVVRRFASFAIALAIAFAPVALAACEASCVSRPGEAAHGHHHHHDTGAAAAAQAGAISTMSGTANACAHGTDLPVVDGTAHVVVAAPPAVLPDIVVQADAPRLIVSGALAFARSPDSIALTTQLRV